ncbi:MAG TPA: biotin transporter BioY [Erysipelotrichaceae bacterium]|nr:biotin transporter BioY [Erysipelotrichaceae bacterium]
MNRSIAIKRITRNALMLALLCVIGMFAIPLGDNIKVSLQLLLVFIIGLTAYSVIDALIITSLYLVIGLFLPIYAGFSAGVTPTFGYVISFVVIVIPLYFLNKIKIKNQFIRMGIACVVSLIICYAIGTIFLSLYLNLDIKSALLISVVPYIPFDFVKIVIAVLVVSILNRN